MKKKCLVVAVLVLLVQSNVLAADTLFLNIPTFVRAKLQFNDDDPILAQGPINLNDTKWILKINNPTGAKIILSNTEDPERSLTLDGSMFEIKDSVVTGQNFKLLKNVRIRVEENGGSGRKNFQIEIRKAPGTVVVGQPAARPQSSTGVQGYVPGSMVYDAVALADDNFNINYKVQILTYYAAGATIDSAFRDNKFLKKVLDEINEFRGQQSGGGLSSILASVGGLDVTKYADGIAKFLVKRVKQELNVAFFEKFRAILDSARDVKTVFPKTAQLLDAIGEEVYDYERYIQNLREAFKADIQVLHRNLPGIIGNHPKFFSDHMELKAALLSGCYIAGELENHAHPGDVLANYPLEYLDSLNNKAFSGALQTLMVLSGSFRDTTTGEDAQYWVPIRSLRQLVNNKLALKYYLGLVYHEAKTKYNSIPFSDNITLVSLLGQVADQYDNAVSIYNAYKRYVLRFAEKTDALNEMIKQYSELPTDSATLEKYGAYLRSVVDLIQYCTQASTLPVINKNVPDLDSLFSKYFQVAYSTSDLLANISKKNYSAAINDVVRIYSLVRVRPLQATRSADKKKTDPATSVAEFNQKNLAKYGSFMANVATAKTPDEVARALETAALPVGSSRVKRETLFNVAINAYVGPYVGYEKIRGVDSGKINSFGITAPIGVSISKGYSILFFNSTKHRSSSSIFFSLIDLGAVTAFRFTNDSTEKVPTIELKQIFSPGIFYSHGFGKTPLSLNIGYQVGPLLRRVRLDENEYRKSYSRISISLVVDIPVFNLYTRSR